MTSLTVAAQSWHGRISLRLFDRDMGTARTSYQWDNATREPRMRSLCLPLRALPCLLGGAGLWGPWRRRLGVYRARPRSAAATHRGASALPQGVGVGSDPIRQRRRQEGGQAHGLCTRPGVGRHDGAGPAAWLSCGVWCEPGSWRTSFVSVVSSCPPFIVWSDRSIGVSETRSGHQAPLRPDCRQS